MSCNAPSLFLKFCHDTQILNFASPHAEHLAMRRLISHNFKNTLNFHTSGEVNNLFFRFRKV